jgi:arginase
VVAPPPRPIGMLGVPTRFGTAFAGSEHTPGLLRREGVVQRLQQWAATQAPVVEVRDAGDVAVPAVAWRPDGKPLRCLDAVLAVAEAQAACVGRLLAAGMAPLVIGGDCTTMLGTAAGLHRAGYRFGLICFDAHGDFNTAETTPSGNIHGMTVAALAGRGAPSLRDLVGGDVVVPSSHIALIGVRDLDPLERQALTAAGVLVVSPAELSRRGASCCGRRALAIACGAGDGPPVDGLLLHLDVDVLDPGEAPGVGLPVAGGLTLDALLAALEPLLNSGRLLAVEITEAAPLLDRSGRTMLVVQTLLRHLVLGLTGVRAAASAP